MAILTYLPGRVSGRDSAGSSTIPIETIDSKKPSGYYWCRFKCRKWRGGRVVYGDGLENRCWLIPNRGFDSHPLRHNNTPLPSGEVYCYGMGWGSRSPHPRPFPFSGREFFSRQCPANSPVQTARCNFCRRLWRTSGTLCTTGTVFLNSIPCFLRAAQSRCTICQCL